MKASKRTSISDNRYIDRDNREGVKGWLNPFKYSWERVSYWLGAGSRGFFYWSIL